MELIASGDQPAYAEAVRRHEQVAAVFSQLTAEQRQRALRFMSERRNPSNAMETMRQGGQRLDRNGLRRDSAEQGVQ